MESLIVPGPKEAFLLGHVTIQTVEWPSANDPIRWRVARRIKQAPGTDGSSRRDDA